jgi:hypothetical protein
MQELISSFNAGELSPYLESRTNLDKYRSGCKVLENFIITPYGPANRRAGTEYRGSSKLPATRSRLIGLNLSDANRIVMELGVGYVRFWKDGALLSSGGSPVEAVGVDYLGNLTGTTPHPYQEADLRAISVCQVNNVVYLAHPSYVPMRLSRFSDTNWKIGEIPWKWSPMGDQNVTSTTITPSALTGAAITLTASSAIFRNDTAIGSAPPITHIGSYWQIAHPNPVQIIDQGLAANATSATIKVLGKWTLQTFGTWTATISLQQSDDNGTNWRTIRTYSSKADYNAVSNGETITSCLMRLVISGASGTGTQRVVFTPIDATLNGFVKITGVSGAATAINGVNYYPTATASVVQSLGNTTATNQWYEGAFSAVQGYPSAISLHESRLIFGGTRDFPSTIWGSVSNDFQNFKTGAYDADSYSFTLASTTGGRVQWILSKTALIIGTTQDEWSLSSSDGTRPLTPTNVLAKKQSNYGSGSVSGRIVNDTVIYVQKMGRKLREFVYSFGSDSWVSMDLTALGEHVTRTGILETAYQRVPDAIYWFVRGDGQLVSMTYEKEQQVVGFARHLISGGEVESVATVTGINAEDEVYVLVKRTINGATTRYVERLKTGMRDALDTADKTNWWFVDSGLLKVAATSTGKTTAISGTYTKTVTTTSVTDANGVTTSVPKTTINVTSTGHGLSVGNTIRVKVATYTATVDGLPVTLSDDALLEDWVVASAAANTLTFEVNSSAVIATGSISFDYVSATITGLGHLEGKAVSVWADNAVGSLIVTQPTVVGGSITLQLPASRVLVGLPFTSTLSPSRIAAQMQDGTSLGRKMRIPRMNVKVYQSLAGEYSTDQVTWNPLVSRTLTDVMDSSPAVINGFERAYVSSNWSDGVDLFIRQTLPVPLTVAAIVPTWEASEGSN